MNEIKAADYTRIATLVEQGYTPDEALSKVATAKVAAEKPARSKYGNVKTKIDGITFDSQREAERYRELKDRADRGEIDHLTIQPRYPLHVLRARSNTFIEIGSYIADFRYTDVPSGQEIVEDVKGMKTDMYRWKKKHVESQYGITIVEVK